VPNNRAVAVLDDLFFTVKILDAAKRAGLAIEFVKSEIDALDKARSAPAVMILDLNCAAIDPVHLITALKADPETKAVNLIGYISHVQGERRCKLSRRDATWCWRGRRFRKISRSC
jgi:ActR/RegA family two-component response regulator